MSKKQTGLKAGPWKYCLTLNRSVAQRGLLCIMPSRCVCPYWWTLTSGTHLGLQREVDRKRFGQRRLVLNALEWFKRAFWHKDTPTDFPRLMIWIWWEAISRISWKSPKMATVAHRLKNGVYVFFLTATWSANPCPGTFKYLEVQFECIVPRKYPELTALVLGNNRS